MREGAIWSLDEETHPEASRPSRNDSSARRHGAHACRRRRHGGGARNRDMPGHVHLAGRHQATRGRMSLLSPARGAGLTWTATGERRCSSDAGEA
jgi:hypothetical protein